ncbi:MAG: hypothetical protein K0U98_18995 [Deltaproteobacteria bacterium]|nr:hypothetical protein [Deltaproteobacteria bacterium]
MTLIAHVLTAILATQTAGLEAQQLAPKATGRLVIQTVHATTLENTVTGENPDRTVAVYLPPSYFSQPSRHFPTLFLLHGIGDTESVWTKAWDEADDPWGTVPRLLDHGIASGQLREMIVVMPDLRSKAGGSFYTDSTVTGRWQEFVTRELPAWVGGQFRSLASAESRGIAGHSMGGYAAIVIGMKFPDVFSVVYGMNSATLDWGNDLSRDNPAFRSVLERQKWEDLKGFYEVGIIAVGQAFSPNPERPPFYVDFPFQVGDGGELVPSQPGHQRWEEHFPIHLVERYRDNLLSLRGLRFDTCNDDEFTHIPPTSRSLSRRLTELEVPHIFEEYNGDHRNRMWGRTGRLYTEVLTWFSLLLEQDGARGAAASDR